MVVKKDGMDGIFQPTACLIPLGTGLARTTQPVGTPGARLGPLSIGELEDDCSRRKELGASLDRFSSCQGPFSRSLSILSCQPLAIPPSSNSEARTESSPRLALPVTPPPAQIP